MLVSGEHIFYAFMPFLLVTKDFFIMYIYTKGRLQHN